MNAQGQREADEMAHRTAHIPLEAIYSSPLERAVDTANALANCHKLPIQIVEGLLEGDAGEWTGKKLSELKRLLESNGAEVVGTATVVWQPAPNGNGFGQAPLCYLAKVDEFVYQDPASCGLCKRGVPLVRVYV